MIKNMRKKFKKLIVASLLSASLFCNTMLASTPMETVTNITYNMDTLLQTVKANEPYLTITNFNGECNRFVKAQLDYLQIMPYWQSPNAGGRIWCSKVQDGTVTATGYQITRIDGANCLYQLLDSCSQPIYNIVISFGNSGWGHVCYIHAIVDNQVYFTDNWTYRGSNLVAFSPIVLDVDTFYNYQVSSNGNINSLLYFHSNGGEITDSENSTLTIRDETKPENLNLGDYFGLDGIITSNYIIEWVEGKITDINGNILQSIKAYPNSIEYRLNHKIDNSLIFNYLPAGDYYYVVTAKDASGTEKLLINQAFYVKEEESQLKITGATKPSIINRGNFFGLDGIITSNYPIIEVYGTIQKANGEVVQEVTVYPNTMEYRLNGVIDNSLIFNYLESGNYRYIIRATDSSQKQKTLINKSFKVK